MSCKINIEKKYADAIKYIVDTHRERGFRFLLIQTEYIWFEIFLIDLKPTDIPVVTISIEKLLTQSVLYTETWGGITVD